MHFFFFMVCQSDNEGVCALNIGIESTFTFFCHTVYIYAERSLSKVASIINERNIKKRKGFSVDNTNFYFII